jgi:DNA-binding CsgD family transcriptional regulator
MDHFDLAQSMIEQCDRSLRQDELAAAFQKVLETLGFRHFACCSHVDPLKPPPRAVMLHTYPAEWIPIYSEMQFYEIDPVFMRAERTRLPFFWDVADFRDELTTAQQEIFAEAKRLGIANGYTVPFHSADSLGALRASCSVIPDSASIDPQTYFSVRLMASYLYEAASRDVTSHQPRLPASTLSRRELQCLEFAAQGKSDWVVGKLLNISERTVHNHIENAKRRLGVVTRVQAVVHALASRQVSFGDVIRADNSDVGDGRTPPQQRRRHP